MKQEKRRVAIITGASRGIGKAIALKLDKNGFIPILVSRSRGDLKKALKDFGKKAVAIPTDVSREKEIVKMAQKVVKEFGRVDVLINNVGITEVGILGVGSPERRGCDQLTKEDFDQMVNTNLGGTFFCMRECIKQMKKQKRGGQIININSIVAKNLFPFKNFKRRSLYIATKAALSHLATAVQTETEEFGIKISTIYPGLVFTEGEASKGIFDIEKLRKFALRPADIAHIVWMILEQGESSNITEVVVYPRFSSLL